MKKLLPLILVFASFFFVANAQENDKGKERLHKISQFQNQRTGIKLPERTSSGNRAIECMPEATYSNAPIDFAHWYTSNTDVAIAAQRVEDLGYPISTIRFFGVQGFFDDDIPDWVPMNDIESFDFEFKFYEDNLGKPGTEIFTKTAHLSHVDTDMIFESDGVNYNVFHWDYTPTAPINGLPEIFWVGIANTNPDAWFLWIDQPNGLGSGSHYRIAQNTWVPLGYNVSLGICIVPALPNSQSPTVPTDLSVTPEPMGVLVTNITWTNPTETFGGDPLTELTTVSILVNDAETPVHIIDNPTIGATETYDFIATETGLYKFTVYGSNSAGDGAKESRIVWLGNDAPAAPKNVVLVAIGNEAKITWEAPSTGLHGGYINPTNTTYSIVRMPDEVEVVTNLTAETYTDTSVPDIGNYQYLVTAHNDMGESGNAASNAVLFGVEGFLILEGFEDWPPVGWTIDGWKDSDWGSPHSGEAWAFSLITGSTLTTSTVPLPTGEVHEFSFHYMAELANYPQGFDVMISLDGEEFTTLAEFTALTNTTYIEHIISLDDYAGSSIQLQFLKKEGHSLGGLCIDDVSLYKLFDNDLAAITASGNTTPSVGLESVYTVSVKNRGVLPQNTYSVKLMREGDLELKTQQGTSITSGEILEYEFTWTPQDGDEGETSIYGVVELIGDEQPANNQTDNLTLIVQPAGTVAVTIGTGTDFPNVRIPFDFYYMTNFSQTLYYPSEIGLSQGSLTSIAYTNKFTADLPEKGVKIWVGETNLTDLSEGWVDFETLTLVYDGTVDFPSGENTILIPLDVPYAYMGGNLVVYTNKVWKNEYFSSNERFKCTNDAGSNRTYHRSVDAELEPDNPGSGWASDWHPNTTLFFIASPTSTPLNQLPNVNAYPNPFDEQISISNVDCVERVIITNILGQQIMDIKLNEQSTISTDALGSGFYLITFEGLDGERTTRKMIKR